MGLPQTIMNFQTLASTLMQRTQNGNVALILKDETATKDFYTYTSIDQVKDTELWSDENLAFLKMTFKGSPSKVYVARVGATTPTLTIALQTLGNKLWDYLAYPGGEAADMVTISTWIKGKRDTDKKTYKAVLGMESTDHEGVICFTTVGLVNKENETFDNIEYTARVAGVIAGIGTDSSVTNYELEELQSITDLADDTTRSAAIDNGELILVNNGESIVISRGVNSLTTTTSTKGEVFKKIRIVEIIDTMRDDITSVIDKTYRGKVLNTYANKLLLVAAINTYLSTLAKVDVLDIEYANLCEIGYEKQRAYLKSINVDVEALDKVAILKYNTNEKVFLRISGKTVDSMEDFAIDVFI